MKLPKYYADKYGIDWDHAADLISDFKKAKGQAHQSPWFYYYGENGFFDIVSNDKLVESYIECRLEGTDAGEVVEQYRPAKTWTDGKKEIIAFFYDWSTEMRNAYRSAKKLKKPKELK